jgi:hypothetical protein
MIRCSSAVLDKYSPCPRERPSKDRVRNNFPIWTSLAGCEAPRSAVWLFQISEGQRSSAPARCRTNREVISYTILSNLPFRLTAPNNFKNKSPMSAQSMAANVEIQMGEGINFYNVTSGRYDFHRSGPGRKYFLGMSCLSISDTNVGSGKYLTEARSRGARRT